MDINNDAVSLYQLNQILKQLLASIDSSFEEYINNISDLSKVADIIADNVNKKIIISYSDGRDNLEIPLGESFTDEQIDIIRKLSVIDGALYFNGEPLQDVYATIDEVIFPWDN